MSIPYTVSGGRVVPEWSEQVAPVLDQSLFWHWIWCEMGKPHQGVVYDVIRRASYIYHYVLVRDSQSKSNFQVFSDTIGNANGSDEILKLFMITPAYYTTVFRQVMKS